jgi:circadian clock protein KaiC
LNNSTDVGLSLARTSTGIEGLDDILKGGLLSHRLYLIDGHPGSGKTTLSLQFLIAAVQRGEKCLYVTLSESRQELEAGARSHGWSLDGIDIVEVLPEEDPEFNGDSLVTMYSPAEVELGESTQRVLDAVKRVSPQCVVFDSLSEMRLLAQNSLRYRRQVLALKHFFAGRRCTVLLVDDGTAEGSDLQLHSIAHGVVSLEQLAPEYGAARRRLRVKKLRSSDFRGGYHDYAIKHGGLVVFPRLIASEHRVEFHRQPIKSGVTALDKLLGGGPDRGTSTLLLGPAGSGKSTIAVQYAVAAADRGDHAVVFAFDESKATLRARTSALGIDFREGSGAGEIRIHEIDPAELSPGEFAAMVRDAVESDNARVVIIDTLNGYCNAMPAEHHLTLQLHELLTYLGRRGVTTLMVIAQHGVLQNPTSTPVDASYLADSVVLFRYFELAGKVKKAISVVKKRSGAHEASIRELYFDERGIHLSDPLTHFRGILTGIPVERDVAHDEEQFADGHLA